MMPLVTKGTREGLRKNQNLKTGSSPDLNLQSGTASIVVQIINIDSALPVGKHARLVVRKITLPKNAGLIEAKPKVKAQVVPRNHSNIEINLDHESSDDGQTDDITSRVRYMYYNDLHFNSVKHTYAHQLEYKIMQWKQYENPFQSQKGADGNLLLLGEFFKHFPNANMRQLAKTIDPHTKLYVINNTEIKQLGVCEQSALSTKQAEKNANSNSNTWYI